MVLSLAARVWNWQVKNRPCTATQYKNSKQLVLSEIFHKSFTVNILLKDPTQIFIMPFCYYGIHSVMVSCMRHNWGELASPFKKSKVALYPTALTFSDSNAIFSLPLFCSWIQRMSIFFTIVLSMLFFWTFIYLFRPLIIMKARIFFFLSRVCGTLHT